MFLLEPYSKPKSILILFRFVQAEKLRLRELKEFAHGFTVRK